MYKLKPTQYKLVLPSLKEVPINHLFALAVANCKVDGEIYVDNPERPSTFLIRHNYGMLLLWGNSQNEAFNQKLRSYLLDSKKLRHQAEWLQASPVAWDSVLENLLGGEVEKDRRLNFQFNPAKFRLFMQPAESEYQLARTDEILFQQMKGMVVPSNFWSRATEFAEIGLGYTILKDGVPVSTAFSAFVEGDELEIGIETQQDYQRLGLAPIACSALIEHCLQHGLTPLWACREGNAASAKLATKLGFEVKKTTAYYKLPNARIMNQISISTDKTKLDVSLIYEFLSERSYWAKGRSRDIVQKSIQNSLCFGAYDESGNQLGFARVATDYSVFGWLMDVFVLEQHRGKGIGKKLIEAIVNHPDLKNLSRLGLGTADAHGLYQQYGFTGLSKPANAMERLNIG
ncbi:GNAT family N-acetyltransferase [Mangrovibacterium diazotrophicum]|uniref:RimJ/RimL family protein N-acetyltransferase n=1 Tax=Mangrovibacterium diazotrophicum TaxID=1261403 RepID=A0A419W700_9BACT|nr:GNAT family N-acetyltransferase [Mangrovibacterium diazotrophicum]RKD91247.1 RimJ/RimL family protein N-acetyltransferase [Mangrovibacterium diazotrophicum]